MWLELLLLFSSLARNSDLGRPGDVHALVPSPRIALVVVLETFRVHGARICHDLMLSQYHYQSL
jgi:hypothetical protein